MKLFVVILLILTQLSFASNGSFERLSNMTLAELVNVHISIASKSDVSIADSPSTVSLFTRKQIDRMGVKYLYQLINHIPGCQATRETLRGDGVIIACRGQFTPQDSHLMLIMVNGNRLNDDLTGGAMVFNHFISLENAERVEVIRGPGSALYGTGAFVGAINIITSNGKNEIKLSAGNNRSKSLSLHASRQFKKISFDIFANYYQDIGEEYGPELTQYRRFAFETVTDPKELLNTQAKLALGKKIEVDYRYKESRLDGFLTALSVGRPGDYTKHKQESLSAVYKFMDKKSAKFKIGAYYTKSEEDRLSTGFNEEEGYSFLDFRTPRQSELKVSAEGQFSLNHKNQVTIGASLRRPKATDAATETNRLDPLSDLSSTGAGALKSSRQIKGLYIQDEVKVSDGLNLTLGLRYDDYSNFSSATNPRAAAVWKIDEHNRIKIMYGEAFRAPSIQETFPFRAGNPDLVSESIKTVESAWVRDMSFGQFSLTYFKSKIKDQINTRINIGGMDSRIFDNLGDLETSGIEFESTLIFNHWTIRNTLTHLIDVSENPRNVSENTASFSINYNISKWNFNIGGHYHDEMEQEVFSQDEFVTLNSYFVTHAKIKYFLDYDTNLFLSAYNLFDKNYYSPSKRNDYFTGLPNRGLEFTFGLELKM